MGNFIGVIFISFLWFISGTGSALAQSDSSAYNVQREKINQLLKERTSKFGDLEKSYRAKTGIFGLKRKKDMQASIDILQEIVQNDNRILQETKALLNFKDIQQKTVEERYEESGYRINGYINTISKLQRTTDEQQKKIEALQSENTIYLLLCIGVGILCLLFLALFIKYRYQVARR